LIEKARSGVLDKDLLLENIPDALQQIDPWSKDIILPSLTYPGNNHICTFERQNTNKESNKNPDRVGYVDPVLVEKYRPKPEELSGKDLSLLLKIILEAGKINELINNEFITQDSHLGFFLSKTNYQIEDKDTKNETVPKNDVTQNFLSSHAIELRNIGEVSNNFSFDFFRLQETKGTNTMIKCMRNFFKQFCVLETFGCNEDTFTNYLGNVFVNYYDNSYHNAIHAMDVVNSAGYIVSCGLLNQIPQFEILALLIASYTHDVGHPGVNQSFLIEIKSGEATIYNDKSILENMHSALAFKLLTKPNSNFTEN
jgi:hypothetical protein